jgi:hypothetical protein
MLLAMLQVDYSRQGCHSIQPTKLMYVSLGHASHAEMHKNYFVAIVVGFNLKGACHDAPEDSTHQQPPNARTDGADHIHAQPCVEA